MTTKNASYDLKIIVAGLLTHEEAAVRLGVSAATIRRLVAAGSIRARRALGRVVVVERDVLRLAARRRAEGAIAKTSV